MATVGLGKKVETPKSDGKKVEVLKTQDGNAEKTEEKANGDAKAKADEEEELKKAEELLEKKLKEIKKNRPRYAPHIVPVFDNEQLKDCCMWTFRLFPVDQEDCKNCILDAATKIAQKSFYHVPKRRNGQGIAELYVASNKDAIAVMSRILRTTFYNRYVTVEVTRRSKEARSPSFKKVEETATIVLDTTRNEKLKNTILSEDPNKLAIRYLSQNTTVEFLRVLFPFSKGIQIQTHDTLKIGLVEVSSKPDLQLFMKAYVTAIINDVSILSIQNKEPMEKESEIKADIEKVVQPAAEWKQVPNEASDKQHQRRDDKNETSRIMKRTMTQQQMADQPPNKRGRMDQQAQRGIGAWGSGIGNQFSGGNRVGFGAGAINPRAVTAEMMMMQARLNQTIRSQLMMLSNRRGFSGFSGGMRGQKGFGGGW